MNELQFGGKVRQVLNQGTQPDEKSLARLRLARNQALKSQRTKQPILGLALADNLIGSFGGLDEALGRMEHIEPPFVDDYATHSYYKYVCRLRPESGIDITRFAAAVAAEGVPISRRYPTPLHKQPVFKNAGLGDVSCPVAERLAGELFTLLVHPTATSDEMDDYVTAIRKVLEGGVVT